MWTAVIYLVLGGPSIVIDGITTQDTCHFIGKNYQEHIDSRAKYQCNGPEAVGGKLEVRKTGDTLQRPEPDKGLSKEVTNAKQNPKAGQNDGRCSTQSGICQKSRHPGIGSQGVQ